MPPVTNQTSHACYSCHHPFRLGTRPLACFAQGCMNLAHAARKCGKPTAPPDQWRRLHYRNITETGAGVPASAFTPREHPRNKSRITCGGCSRTIAANVRPFVCNDCSTSYHRTCSGLSRDTANTVTNTGHRSCLRCLSTAASAPAHPLPSHFVVETKHHQIRQALRQWNADGLAKKQHELRLRLSDDICLIQDRRTPCQPHDHPHEATARTILNASLIKRLFEGRNCLRII